MSDTIANRLRTLRMEHEISQEKLAEELDIARTTVSHLENGNREPSLYVLMAYAEYFGVSTDWILFGKEYEE
jgi:transcriptional regulator with XRE-family HTH domain